MRSLLRGGVWEAARGGLLLTGLFVVAALLALATAPTRTAPGSAARAALGTASSPCAAGPAAAAGDDVRLLLRHGHTHGLPEDTTVPEKGRALAVAPGGAQVAAAHVEDELLLRAQGPIARADLERALARLDLAVIRHDAQLDVYVVRATGADRVGTVLPRLAAQPWVEWVEPNYVATVSQCCHVPFSTEDDPVNDRNAVALRNCGIEAAQRETTGSANVIVAVLDTGIDARHKNLAGQLLPGYDLVNAGGTAADDAGHGTAMAGLIAGLPHEQRGIRGVAPACKLLPIKVADHRGNASIADLATGITYAVGQGARIINLSLGCRVGSRTLEAAVDYAWSRGALLVAAVGNDNVNAALYPAAYDKVLAVASVGPEGDLGFATNICPEADIAAPGEKILSTIPGNFYRGVSGTSCAAAIVSGTAALLLAKNPSLTGPELYALLKYSARPIAALAPVRDLFRFGRLDAAAAMRRAGAPYRDLALTRARCLPRAPMPGQAAVLEIEVENQGTTPATVGNVGASLAGKPLAAPCRPFDLAVGARATVQLPWTPAVAGAFVLTASVASVPGEANVANNALAVPVTVAGVPDHALVITDIGTGSPAADGGSLDFHYTVRNLGNVPENQVTLRARVGGREFGWEVADLAPGASHTATFPWRVPTPAPKDAVGFVAAIEPAGFAPARPIVGYFDVILGTAEGRPVRVQYQQSGDVDIIPDAPYRLKPGHPYLPLMIFVPDKGSGDTTTALTFDDCKIYQKDAPDPAAPGTLLYEDSFGPEAGAPPTTVAPGLTIIDEMGALQATEYGVPDLNLFKDVPLTQRGRHVILRFPRGVLGVPTSPAAPVVRYYDVQITWTYSTHALGWTATKHGTTTKMLKVEFGTSALPTLPGVEGRYFDAHVHTIAEWYFSDHIEVFSPMQAFGGPIQMIKECAWAVGLTSGLDDVKDNLITTDHNCFYGSPLDLEPNSTFRRPPYGPTSVAASTGPDGALKSEFARMREIFGIACGEELAFSEYVVIGPAAVPIGGHMLSYRGQHFDGTWHGGSDVSAGLHEGDPIYLETFLSTLASANPAENAKAFTYAAHPFSKQGWTDINLNKSLGLDPLYRTHDYVSPYGSNFVLKGLQIFNEGHRGYLPGDTIDFNHLNPFLAPTWAGSPDWDRELQIGLTHYHGYLATLLKWNFLDEIGKVFPRKLYLSGGTDAHGDFNYSQHRLATLIEHPSTYTVTSMAFGNTRTYTFGDGKAGTTPGERGIDALAGGNSIATDGPVVNFDLDGDGHFDSTHLKWHDGSSLHEDAEGRMGGDGAFDGGRTVLVKRGSPDLFFHYVYDNSPDLGSAGGAVAAIKIYKDQEGTPNPTMTRTYAGAPLEVIKGVGSLPTTGAGSYKTKKVDLAAEGSVTKLTAFSLGAFTGGDPDVAPLPAIERKCYTNPVWAVPVDFDIAVTTSGITAASPKIPAGAVTVTFKFDASMMPLPYAVHIKPLDGSGNSTDATVPPASACAPFGSGWTLFAAKGVTNGVYTVKNTTAIPLTGATYPAAGKYSFVVYFKDAPKDLHGNALNSVAKTFTVDAPAASGGKKCFVGLLAEQGPGSGEGAGAATTRWILWFIVLALLVTWEVFGQKRLSGLLQGRRERDGGPRRPTSTTTPPPAAPPAAPTAPPGTALVL